MLSGGKYPGEVILIETQYPSGLAEFWNRDLQKKIQQRLLKFMLTAAVTVRCCQWSVMHHGSECSKMGQENN